MVPSTGGAEHPRASSRPAGPGLAAVAAARAVPWGARAALAAAAPEAYCARMGPILDIADLRRLPGRFEARWHGAAALI